jgi:DNA end-binding protein Ku
MVSVPVRLFAATEEPSRGVSFNLLHGKCGSRVKQQYVCQKDGDVLERTDMVKGYEFAKGQYVTFSEEELKALLEDPSPAIEISEFVPAEKVDPVFFQGAYYVGPGKGGERAYALLAVALRKSGRCAIARWSARGRQHLVMFRAFDVVSGAPLHPALAMQVLYLADEVRDAGEYSTFTEVGARELKLAMELIKRASSPAFRPEAYKDGARERIQAAIARKVKGEDVVVAAPPPGEAKPTVDLFQALQASLKKRRPAARARRAA